MSLWTEIESLLGIATATLPAIAAANTANNPAATNTGVINTAKAIALVQPLVQAGDALSSSATPLTGAQKLANAQQAIAVAVQVGTAAGVITQPEAAFLPIILSAINAACALKNAQATPPTNPPA